MMISMRTALATAAMAVPLLIGCGGASGDEATMAGLPGDLSGPGMYTVPADPTVQFAVSKIQVEEEGGTVTVYYDLPADFAPDSPHVVLSGTPDGTNKVHLSGAAGTSTCTIAAASFWCDEKLSGVHFDAQQAMAALPPGDPRAAAVDAFISEPIGVLTLAVPAAAP
jgi:hypothetical protein